MINFLERVHEQTHPHLALILRHGDRDKIPAGEFGDDVMLNEKGIQRSIQFGELLKEKCIRKIYTSPVGRCVQTGENIAKGYGRTVEIIPTKALGAPGLHISDARLAGEFFLRNGFFAMHDLFTRGEPVPGMPDADTFRSEMNNFVDTNTAEQGITLFVTHDSLVALYAFALSGKVYTRANWVNYLTGIIRPVI